MCCFTHGNVLYGPPAADKRMRCRCDAGSGWQCDRQADAEDLLCAVCRVGIEPPTFINPTAADGFLPDYEGFSWSPPLRPERSLPGFG